MKFRKNKETEDSVEYVVQDDDKETDRHDEATTYIDKKIDIHQKKLLEKKAVLETISGEIESYLDKIKKLETIKKSRASLLIVDILDMIDDYRDHAGNISDLLDDMENEVMDIAIKK